MPYLVRKLLIFSLFILSHTSFTRNNGAKKHFNKFHANSILSGWSDWRTMTSAEQDNTLLVENRSWTEFIRLIQ